MSDIPIGSPPAPPGRHAAPGGWYADPVDPNQERYWDGWQWSRNTRPRAGDPPPAANVAAYPGAVGPAPVPGAIAGPVTADGVPLAGWGWRALGAVLDSVFVSLLVSALTFPIYADSVGRLTILVEDYLLARQSDGGAPLPDLTGLYSPQEQLVTTLVAIAVGLTYQLVALRWKRATLGKAAVGLRVVPVDQGQFTGRLSWNAIVLRSVLWVVPGAVSSLLLLRVADIVLPLWHPRRQALHDLIAKTQVVRPRRADRPISRVT